MRSSKGDGVKYIQSKEGYSAAIETTPLFPRLHINDTERAGPRAPPRNKMALYEQFTVPSHRFKQANSMGMASANTQQQIGPNDYGYLYANMNYGVALHTQPSFGMSSCITSSDSALVCNQEMSKTLSAEKSTSQRALRVVVKNGGSATMVEQHKTEHKSKDMSMGSTLLQQSPRKGDPQKLPKAGGGMQRHCYDMSDSVKLGEEERPTAMDATEELQEALSNVEPALQCTMFEKHNGETSTCMETAKLEKRKEGNDNVQLKGKSSTDGPSEQSDGISPTPPDLIIELPVVDSQPDRILLLNSLSHANDISHDDPSSDGRSSAAEHVATEEEPSPSSPLGAFGKDEVQTTPKEEVSGELSLPNGRDDGNKDDNVAEKILVKSPPKINKDGSIKQIENKQPNISNLSGPYQARVGVGGPQGSMHPIEGAVSAHDIRPKDMIHAVGQQQFWKARKALLRQQRIFSDQVFQLHKLIKVQQLFAETPVMLIDDEMPFRTMEENDALHESISEGELCPGEEGNNKGSSFEARNDDEQGENYSGNSQASDEHVTVGNGVGSTPPFIRTRGSGGISAWGYPSQGMGQWMGPVQAPSGHFSYQPVGGAFPLGPAYGGFYGMPMSFGTPFNCQAYELREEVSSNHGSGAARMQPVSGLASGPLASGQMATHTPSDVAHMLQYMQYSNPHYSQLFYDHGSGEGVPVGSVASINNQKAFRAPSSSRMRRPLGFASHSVGVDGDTCEQSVYQDESSSPIGAPKAEFKPSTRRPLNSHRDVEQLPQHPDTENTRRPQNFMAVRAGLGRTDVDIGPKMSRKFHLVASTTGVVEEISACGLSMDHSENALDLFPQVPSVNTGFLVGWKKHERLAEERQSRVIKAIPHPAVAASQSTAGILLSLQQERQR